MINLSRNPDLNENVTVVPPNGYNEYSNSYFPGNTYLYAQTQNMMQNMESIPGFEIRRYVCKVCGKKYKNLNGLKYHGRIVHPTLDFKKEVRA